MSLVHLLSPRTAATLASAASARLAVKLLVTGVAALQRCDFHCSTSVRSPPQPGGYLRTGVELPGISDKILVTGASGQIGAEFVPFLRER